MPGSTGNSSSTSSSITTAAPPQTFLDLPDSMHTVVARFLKLREPLTMTTQLRASQGWSAREDLYLYWHADLHELTLVDLLERFHCVRKLSVASGKFVRCPARATYERGIRELHIIGLGEQLPDSALDYLSSRIERGAMPLLEVLSFEGRCEKDGLISLLCGFCKGASPNLHALSLPLYNDGPRHGFFNGRFLKTSGVLCGAEAVATAAIRLFQ